MEKEDKTVPIDYKSGRIDGEGYHGSFIVEGKLKGDNNG